MSMSSTLVSFLTTDPAFKAINFKFFGYKVYPEGYTRDVAGCISDGKSSINQRFSDLGFKDTGGSYFVSNDSYSLSAKFSLNTNYEKIIIAHESTHAPRYYQRLGKVPVPEAEAVAYLAETIFVRTNGWAPLNDPTTGSPHPIRMAADVAAAAVLAGAYDVPNGLASAIVAEVKLSAHYGPKATDFLNCDGIG